MKRTLFIIVILLVSYGIVLVIHTPSSAQYPTYLNIYPYYSSQSTYPSTIPRNLGFRSNFQCPR